MQAGTKRGWAHAQSLREMLEHKHQRMQAKVDELTDTLARADADTESWESMCKAAQAEGEEFLTEMKKMSLLAKRMMGERDAAQLRIEELEKPPAS